MKAKDMIENYLIELGVSLKNNYFYIPSSDYEYSSTKGKTETIKLGNYDVKLDKIIRNTRELIWVTNIARNEFINNVTLSGDVAKACDKLMGHSVLYFTEFVKYIANNIDIKVDFAEKLIALANGAIENTGRELDNVMQEFNVKMDNAREKGAQHHADLTANAIAEANKIKGFHTNVYNTSGLFSESYTIYATPITTGTAKRNEMVSMASAAANQIQSVYEEIANDRAIESLRKVRTKIVNSFNEKLKELLSIKLDSYFEEKLLENEGKNISDNPIIYNHYLNVINELTEEQFDDFKKATEYYRIYLLNDLKKIVEDNIYNAFSKENECNYNEIDYKVYVYLKGDDFGPGSDLCKRIKANYTTQFKDHISFKENQKYIKNHDSYRNKINNCRYLSDQDKKEIIKSYDDFKIKAYKNRNNNIIDFALNSIMLVIGIIAFIIAFQYMKLYAVYNGKVYLYCIGGMIASLVIGGLVYIMKKNLFKKILQCILIVGFTLVPIFLSKPVAEEKAKREGKFVIQLEILDEKQVLLLAEGERIPLDNIQRDGYVFNGWLEDEKYVFEERFVEGNEKFEANLYSTSENLTTVTFKLNNGEKNIVLQLPLYEDIYKIPYPEKSGYTFDGWYDEKLYKKQWSGLRVWGENLTFRAEWVKY